MTHLPVTVTAPDFSLLDQPRFQEPADWRWHRFLTQGGYRLRYGTASPKDSIADAVVVILPGLGDFAEQYFETARQLLARNFAVWVIDWRGQGGSDRYLGNRQKRHSAGFGYDVRDLNDLIANYVIPSSVHPEVGRLPLVMLGHSMGGHLGLRYLHDYNISSKGKQVFSVAAFCAPMFWVRQLESLPIGVCSAIWELFCLVAPTSYVPGGSDWTPDFRNQPIRKGIYSHDPERALLHETWFAKDPQLQVGSPTNKWLYEAAKSCRRVNHAAFLNRIAVPTLIATAGDERIVSNKIAERAVKLIPETLYLPIAGAEHEILMESDQYRQVFLDQFFALVDRNVLSKSHRGLTKF